MLIPNLAAAIQPAVTSEKPSTVGQEVASEDQPSTLLGTSEQAAPADLVPPARLWERLAWYAGSTLFTCVLIFTGFRLDQADLKAPFYYDLDSLLILPMVKATIERGPGGHWHNERLGAPGILDLNDFPVIDHLHFFLIWLLSKLFNNVVLVYNLYFLLTFPLTTFTAMIAFRQLRLTLPAAAVGGLLYSFLPYHYQRWENHYFLAAYWLVPLGILPILAICKGEYPFFRKVLEGCCRLRHLKWSTAGLMLLCAAIASAGAYYAFFTCAFIGFAGLYATVVFRDWRALASASILVSAIVLFGFVNHIPTFVYQAEYGRNSVVDREPEEVDHYGLKIAHLLLPIEDHNLTILVKLKWLYNSPRRVGENENKSASLGVIGVLGLVGLVVLLFLPQRPGWPFGALAALSLFGIFLGSIGGLGSIFNLLITAQIRAYNRISIFIAFFCLCAFLWVIDRFLVRQERSVRLLHLTYACLPFVWVVLFPMRELSRKWRERIDHLRDRLRPRMVPIAMFVWMAVFLIGFLDETPYSWFKSEISHALQEQASRYRSDERFFGEIEKVMPAGTKVFCLPYLSFPESPPLHNLAAYEHIRGYLHTNTLLWSFGAMKGREADAWQQDVSFRTPEEVLQRIVCRGFEGLFIDTRGYPSSKNTNHANAIIREINKKYADLIDRKGARLPEIIHEDGRQSFLDLRPYRDEWRLQIGPANFEAKVREEQEWVAVIWLGKYYVADPIPHSRLSSEESQSGETKPVRYAPPDASVWFINPSDRTRQFKIGMVLAPMSLGLFQMRLSGLVQEEFALDKKSPDWASKKEGIFKEYTIEVPPGRHPIHLHCTPPEHFIFNDFRKLCYSIGDFKMEEKYEEPVAKLNPFDSVVLNFKRFTGIAVHFATGSQSVRFFSPARGNFVGQKEITIGLP